MASAALLKAARDRKTRNFAERRLVRGASVGGGTTEAEAGMVRLKPIVNRLIADGRQLAAAVGCALTVRRISASRAIDNRGLMASMARAAARSSTRRNAV